MHIVDKIIVNNFHTFLIADELVLVMLFFLLLRLGCGRFMVDIVFYGFCHLDFVYIILLKINLPWQINILIRVVKVNFVPNINDFVYLIK